MLKYSIIRIIMVQMILPEATGQRLPGSDIPQAGKGDHESHTFIIALVGKGEHQCPALRAIPAADTFSDILMVFEVPFIIAGDQY